ncbi:DsbA family protein [Candidatus Nomurabacteria bacterium]|nr:DsbA family protein [Candidatus Nomurabacteria bacterium]
MNRFWIILTIVVVGLVGLFFMTKKNTSQTNINSDPKAVSETDHVRGDKNSPVTLIEYADFQCPGCKSYYPILKSLESKYEGKVRFVFRHFPLIQIHPNAFAAARAAEAAGNQDKFFEMHDKLYETQDLWGQATTNQQALFEDYAKELGLDMTKFTADYKSTAVADRINADVESGKQVFSVNSTPTFIIDGEKIKNPTDVAGFSKLLDTAIEKATTYNSTN